MDYRIGFIKYSNNNTFFQKIKCYVFKNLSIDKIDDNKCVISVGNKKVTQKRIEKFKNLLLKNEIRYVTFEKYFSRELIESFENDFRFNILDGKLLMKYMSKEIIEYIFSVGTMKKYETDLYVTTQNDKYMDIIIDLSKDFKNLNIVTSVIKKLKRCDQKLEKMDDIVYSISCNRLKALRKAKIIVNFDFEDRLFKSFKIRNDAIIINVSSKRLSMEKSFHGVIAEGFEVDCNKDDTMLKQNFSCKNIIESYMLGKSYAEARRIIEENNYKIVELRGIHGKIETCEIEGNIY